MSSGPCMTWPIIMVNWDQSNKVYYTLYSRRVAFLFWKIIRKENTRKAKIVLILKPQMTQFDTFDC